MGRTAPRIDEYGNLAPQAAPPQQQHVGGTDEQVRAAFLKYLGHENTSNIWQDDPNWESDIANSPEGKQYAAQQAQNQASASPTPTAPAPVPAAGPNGRVTSPNGWYVEGGTHTYDQNGMLQGILGQGGQGYNRAALADALYQLQIAGGDGSNFNLDQWLAQHQDIAMGVKSGKGGEMLLTPDGGAYDIRRGYNAQNNTGSIVSFGAAGGNEGDRGGAGAGGGYGGGYGGGGGYQGSVSGTINGSSGGANDPMNAAVQAAILKQLGTLQDPTDPNSATVKAITDPYHLQTQRGLEATRRALAEQAYANGNMNTGGYAGSQIAAVEKAGADEANFTGQTVATQEAQRQAMLMSILGLGNNMSQFSQQLSATQKNFADQLAQNDRQFAASLGNAVAQFGQSMGYQYALLDWSKTQKAIDSSTAPVTGV